jgi:hypothetical protein
VEPVNVNVPAPAVIDVGRGMTDVVTCASGAGTASAIRMATIRDLVVTFLSSTFEV